MQKLFRGVKLQKDLSLFIVKNPTEAKLAAKFADDSNFKVMAFTPLTFDSIKSFPNSVKSEDYYGNVSHLKTAINQKEFCDAFEQILANSQTISETAIIGAKNYFYNIVGIACFYYYSIRGFKEYIWVENNQIVRGGFEQALISLMKVVIRDNYTRSVASIGFAHKILMRLHNSLMKKKLYGKKIALAIDGPRPMSLSFANEIAKFKDDVSVVCAKRIGKSFFSTLKFVLKSKKTDTFFFYPARVLEPKLNLVSENKILNLIFEASKDYLLNLIMVFEGYNLCVQKSGLVPSYIITDSIHDGFENSICKITKENEGKVVFFNHGSHSLVKEKVGNFAQKNLAIRGRVYSKFATHFVERSPSTRDLLLNLADVSEQLNVISFRRNQPIEATQSDKFKVLYAGTFAPVNNHMPWIMETPFEFLEGLKALAEIASTAPNVELIVRIRERRDNRDDLNEELIKRELAGYNNIVFDNKTQFQQLLKESGLLVANLSVTIDEALESARPVLLHSASGRYHHLPAQTALPAPESRSAVYASNPETSLSDLLNAIATCHHNKPLTRDELSDYVWDLEAGDLKDAVKRFMQQ